MMEKPKTAKDVKVKLIGSDGNVFAIIGKVTAELKKAGFKDEAKAFAAQAMGSKSYEEVLCLCMDTVEVE